MYVLFLPVCVLVAQSCPTLCDPMDCTAHQALGSMGFSRQGYWSGLPLPSPPFIAPLIFTFCLLLALAQFALHFSSSFKVYGGFPGGSDGKESACNVGDLGSIPG